MVGVLIRMRLRLLANTVTGMQAMTMGLGLLAGLSFAALGVWLGLADLGSDRASADLLALLFALWTLGWALGPVFLGGSGATLFPEFFAALPLRPRKLARGLLAASFVGIGPAVTAAAFAAGVAYATRHGSLAVTVAVVAMVLQLLVVVTFSKVMVDLVGAAITSTARAVVSALPWAVLAGFGAQSWLLGPLVSRVDGFDPALSAVLRWLPSGWGLVAIDAAGAGNWALVTLPVAGLALLLVALPLTWSRLLTRRTTTVVTVRPATARSAGSSHGPRSGWLRVLPATPAGSVAAKEVRTTLRDLNRALLLSYAVWFALTVTLAPLLVRQTVYLAATGVIIALLATTGSAQLYSNDGTALWLTLMTPGRQLGWLLLVAPTAIVCTVVGGLLAGRAWTWPWALALLPAALGGGAGAIVLVSVYALIPMAAPKQRTTQAAGGDGSTGLIAWAMLPLSLLTVVPAAVFPLLGLLLDNAALGWLGVPAGLATGAGWWFVCGRTAHRRLTRRGPELLARLRSGPQSALDPSAQTADRPAAPPEPPRRPMPVSKAILIWFLYLTGFLVLMLQAGVGGILAAAGTPGRTWFLMQYLPHDLRTAGITALAVLGVLAIVGSWLLSRPHDKPARKRFRLP